MRHDVPGRKQRRIVPLMVIGVFVAIVATGAIVFLRRPQPKLDDVLREELPDTPVSYTVFVERVSQRYGIDEQTKAWWLKPLAGPEAWTRSTTAAEWLSKTGRQFKWLTAEEPSKIYQIYEIACSDYGTRLHSNADNIHYWFAVDREGIIIAYAIERTY